MSNNLKIDNEKWINSIKESLSDYSVSPPKDGWERISASLAKNKAPRLKTYKKIIIGTIASAAALFILFFSITNINNPQNITDYNIDYLSENIDNKNIDEDILNSVEPPIVDPSIAKPSIIDTKTIIYNIDDMNKSEANEVNEASETSETIEASETIEENEECKESVETKDTEQKKNDKDNKITWEEYLKEEEKSNKLKVIKKNENNKTLLAIAAGSNGFNSSNLKKDHQLNYNDKYLNNSISPYYNYFTEYAHSQPLTISVMIGKNIGKNITIETGLSFTNMRSRIKGLKQDGKEVKQTLNYIGIPVKFNWNFINKTRYSIYTGFGGFIERNIHAVIDNKKVDINKWQGGVLLNVGAQFKFNEHIALYAEPGLTYYIGMHEDGSIGKMKNSLDIKSIRSENPLGFSLSAGFRFAF